MDMSGIHSSGLASSAATAVLAALAVCMGTAPLRVQAQAPGQAQANVQAQAAAPVSMPAAAQAAAPAPLAVGAPRTLPSGVEVTLTRAGRTPASYPGPTDSVTVHYEGTFLDGRVFDSSYERKQAATFPLNRVIPCWTQGVQQIPVGGAATLNCPASAAYGERGAGGGRIPPNTPLRFKVELIEIQGR